MNFREARPEDIEQMQRVRNAVQENKLSDPGLVTYQDYMDYLFVRGKGWVCEADGMITGFAIADIQEDNIWALFVLPEFEGKGIGSRLHDLMLHWYFAQNKNRVWLSTAPGTRAEAFYRRKGWIEMGTHGNGEVKFEKSAGIN